MLIDLYKIKDLEPNVPCYCYNKAQFINNVFLLREVFNSEVKLLFSIKANPFFTEAALNHTDGIEICSVGELFHADNCKADPNKIIFGGVCKEEADFEDTINYGIRKFSIESLSQLLLLENVAARYQSSVAAILRISTGNQFGMSINDIITCIKKLPIFTFTKIVGVHYYPGTMRITEKSIDNDFTLFDSILRELNELGIVEIEYGAGIGIDYYGNNNLWTIAAKLASKLNTMTNRFQITYEAGRILAADAGCYITRVIDIKENAGRIFVIVNGGRHHFTLHGGVAKLGKNKPLISTISKYPTNEKVKCTIVGALCNTGDILANNVELPALTVNDYVVFHNAGAYSVTEGTTLFLSRDMPAIFFAHNDTLEMIRPKNKTEWLKTFYGEKKACEKSIMHY